MLALARLADAEAALAVDERQQPGPQLQVGEPDLELARVRSRRGAPGRPARARRRARRGSGASPPRRGRLVAEVAVEDRLRDAGLRRDLLHRHVGAVARDRRERPRRRARRAGRRARGPPGGCPPARLLGVPCAHVPGRRGRAACYCTVRRLEAPERERSCAPCRAACSARSPSASVCALAAARRRRGAVGRARPPCSAGASPARSRRRRPVLRRATSRTRVESFDGVPLDVNVTLPPAAQDGPFPLIVELHGCGRTKSADARDRARARPATSSSATRRAASASRAARSASRAPDADARRTPTSARERGWVRLGDARYEARDTQYLAGLLVDEGLVAPEQVGGDRRLLRRRADR